MKKFASIMLASVMLLSLPTSSFAESKFDLFKSEDTARKVIEKDVRDMYRNDKEFQMMVNEYGPKAGEEMIQMMVDSKLEKSAGARMIAPTAVLFDTASVDAPLIKQINSYYCGPANALQVIYSLGKEGSVSGSTDSSKQSTLGSNMGTASGVGTYVYKMRNELNKYVSSNQFSYIQVKGNLSYSDFLQGTFGSLANDRAPILHAKTQFLSYYNGYSTGHYITIQSVHGPSETCTLLDTNPNAKYYGYQNVPVSEAFDAVGALSGRYLIYNP